LRIIIASVLSGLLTTPVAAGEQGDAAAVPLPRGQMIWGVAGSAGFTTGDRASGFGAAMVRMDRVVSAPRGPGWFRGQLGYSLEIVPVLVLSQGEATYAAGFNLVGRHYLGSGARRPFVTLGAGFLVSADEIPNDATNLNFTPQAGFGFLFTSESGPSYSVELRVHHLSNGGRAESNPGLNSAVVQFGVSFPNR